MKSGSFARAGARRRPPNKLLSNPGLGSFITAVFHKPRTVPSGAQQVVGRRCPMLLITPNKSSCAPRVDRDTRARYAQAPLSALFMRMRHRTGRLLVLMSLLPAAATVAPLSFVLFLF